MIKWLLILIGTFSLGIYIGQYLSEPSTSLSTSSSDEEIRALKLKVAELEKRVQRSDSVKEASTPATPLAMPSALPVTSPLEEKVESDAPPVTEPIKKKWRAAERNIRHVRTPSDLGAFLERVKIDDFMSEVQGVRPITESDPILDYLSGNFVGRMASQSDIPNFNIAMDANISVQNQQLRGRVSIRLSRNGRTFSRGANNGDIQNVQHFGEKSLAVLINAGDFFFQLYYMPQLESFEGNCYQQSKPGTMRFVGTVHLERV